MFLKGQKVVCVDDNFSQSARLLFKQLPVKDVVYTVREVYVGRGNILKAHSGTMEGEIGILLVELVNPPDPSLRKGLLYELGFKAERFAPLETLPDEEAEEGEKTWEELEAEKYAPVPKTPLHMP
jgi:hypothetical protein